LATVLAPTAVHALLTTANSPTHCLILTVSHSAVVLIYVTTSPVKKFLAFQLQAEQSVAVEQVSQLAIQALQVFAAPSNQYLVLQFLHSSILLTHSLHLLAAVHTLHTLPTLKYPAEHASHSSAFVQVAQPVNLQGHAFPAYFVPS